MKIQTSNRLGLVLGSGGPRGLAHIGVIKALEENNIPIGLIVGTSAGSLIGGLYAAMESIGEVERIANTLKINDLISVLSDVGLASGIIKGAKIEPFLDKYIKGRTIESLKIPYAAGATDLSTGKAVMIQSGSLSKAIHASSAIPGLFESVEWQSKKLVDGNVSCPVPVRMARKMGATFIVAVNLESYSMSTPKPSISSVSIGAITMLQANLAKEQSQEADITIIPDTVSVSPINLAQFVDGADIIQKGYEATTKLIPLIRKKL